MALGLHDIRQSRQVPLTTSRAKTVTTSQWAGRCGQGVKRVASLLGHKDQPNWQGPHREVVLYREIFRLRDRSGSKRAFGHFDLSADHGIAASQWIVDLGIALGFAVLVGGTA